MNGVKGLYRGQSRSPEGVDRPPCCPRGGDRAPCRPWVGAPVARGGWATGPLSSRAPGQGLKKKLYLWHVAPPRATGVYFRNFSKRTYIFKVLIFLNIKKKKRWNVPSLGGEFACLVWKLQPLPRHRGSSLSSPPRDGAQARP